MLWGLIKDKSSYVPRLKAKLLTLFHFDADSDDEEEVKGACYRPQVCSAQPSDDSAISFSSKIQASSSRAFLTMEPKESQQESILRRSSRKSQPLRYIWIAFSLAANLAIVSCNIASERFFYARLCLRLAS